MLLPVFNNSPVECLWEVRKCDHKVTKIISIYQIIKINQIKATFYYIFEISSKHHSYNSVHESTGIAVQWFKTDRILWLELCQSL